MGVQAVGLASLKRSQIYDLIPIVSTFSNLVELFLKVVVLPFKSSEAVKGNYYFTHLKEKSVFHSLLLLIPGLGNILVLILNRREKSWFIAEIEKDHDSDRLLKLFQRMAQKFAIDEEVLEAFVSKDKKGLIYPYSRVAQHSLSVTRCAVIWVGTNFIHADPLLQQNKDLIFHGLEDWPAAAAYLSPEQAEEALKKNPLCCAYLLGPPTNQEKVLEVYQSASSQWKELLRERFSQLAVAFDEIDKSKADSSSISESPKKATTKGENATLSPMATHIQHKIQNAQRCERAGAGNLKDCQEERGKLQAKLASLSGFDLAFHQKALRAMGREREAAELPQKVPPCFRPDVVDQMQA